MPERRPGRFKGATASWSPLKKSLIIVLIAVIVYGAVIAMEGPVITKMFGEENVHPDIDVYRARTSTILDGGLLYADVHTETPPLINYLLVPAQLLGGGDHVWVYSAYFSFFGLLSAMLIYHILRRYDDHLAFTMALLFVLSPFGFIEAGSGNDETIVAFTVLVPALLMVLERNRLASVAMGLCIWTKMWAILLAPIHFLQSRTWKERGYMIGIIGAVSAAVAAPFLMLCGDDFTWFLRYYFIGNSERKIEGFSVFQFLESGGYGVPMAVELALVLIGLLAVYLYAYRKNLGKWESITIALAVFFVLYPKIHTGYYLIPVMFLLAWAAENRRIAARCFLMYVPVILAVAFSPTADGYSFFQFEGSWIFGLVCSLAASAMLLETTYAAMRTKPFITRAIERAAEGDRQERTATMVEPKAEAPGLE